ACDISATIMGSLRCADSGVAPLKGGLSGRGKRPLDRLGIVLDHFEQDPGRPFRDTAALLPIAQRTWRNAKTRGKLGLRQSKPLADRLHVDVAVKVNAIAGCFRLAARDGARFLGGANQFLSELAHRRRPFLKSAILAFTPAR